MFKRKKNWNNKIFQNFPHQIDTGFVPDVPPRYLANVKNIFIVTICKNDLNNIADSKTWHKEIGSHFRNKLFAYKHMALLKKPAASKNLGPVQKKNLEKYTLSCAWFIWMPACPI